MSQRKSYSAELKAEAVELARSSSSSASQVARELGLKSGHAQSLVPEMPALVANGLSG